MVMVVYGNIKVMKVNFLALKYAVSLGVFVEASVNFPTVGTRW
jgi:hypothetical protein